MTERERNHRASSAVETAQGERLLDRAPAPLTPADVLAAVSRSAAAHADWTFIESEDPCPGGIAALRRGPRRPAATFAFVATPAAFSELLRDTGIAGPIERVLEAAATDSRGGVAAACDAARAMVACATIPSALARTLADCHATLVGDRLDLEAELHCWCPDAPRELHHRVRYGMAELAPALQACWASPFSPAAVTDRMTRALAPHDARPWLLMVLDAT